MPGATFAEPPQFNISLWGSSANDVYAAGANNVVHWDRGAWAPVHSATSLTDPLTTAARVWGTSADTIYVDEGNGEVFQSIDGGVWTFIPELGGQRPFAISGTGPDDIWVPDTVSLKLNHWDGTRWTHSQLPSTELNAFFVTDPHHAWAVGENGQILRHTH